MAGDTTERSRRPYSSPKRRQQADATRAAVLEHAAARFGERGWAGTGMRDVAKDAGVSVETIYATFGNKADLLMAALDLAVVGDTAPVPLGARPEFVVLGEGDHADRVRAAANLVRAVNARTRGIGRALREGAASDVTLATRLAAGERNRRADVAHAAELVAGRAVTATESEGVWAVTSTEVFDLLVDRAGWSEDVYEDWLADTIGRLLPGDAAS